MQTSLTKKPSAFSQLFFAVMWLENMHIKHFLVLIALILITPLTCHACKCAYEETPEKPAPKTFEEIFDYYPQVFCGSVVEIKYEEGSKNVAEVTLQVHATFKGKKKKAQVVKTNWHAVCGFPFIFGQSYLVWSRGMSSTCDPTKLATESSDDLLNILKVLNKSPEEFIGQTALERLNQPKDELETSLTPETSKLEYYVVEKCKGRYAT